MARERIIARGVLVLLFVVLFVCVSGCGSEIPEDLTASPVDETTMVDQYVEAYRKVDYRKMWNQWPPETFGGKVRILADMKKDIFRNYYSKDARLKVEHGDIVPGTREDRDKILSFFSVADIRYVTDVYRTEYKAEVDGGERDGEIYKEGMIYVFRNHGKWFAFDD